MQIFILRCRPFVLDFELKKNKTRILVDPAENEQREFHESVKYVLALSYSKTQTNFPVLWQTKISSHSSYRSLSSSEKKTVRVRFVLKSNLYRCKPRGNASWAFTSHPTPQVQNIWDRRASEKIVFIMNHIGAVTDHFKTVLKVKTRCQI